MPKIEAEARDLSNETRLLFAMGAALRIPVLATTKQGLALHAGRVLEDQDANLNLNHGLLHGLRREVKVDLPAPTTTATVPRATILSIGGIHVLTNATVLPLHEEAEDEKTETTTTTIVVRGGRIKKVCQYYKHTNS
jgi:hypothetical protein